MNVVRGGAKRRGKSRLIAAASTTNWRNGRHRHGRQVLAARFVAGNVVTQYVQRVGTVAVPTPLGIKQREAAACLQRQSGQRVGTESGQQPFAIGAAVPLTSFDRPCPRSLPGRQLRLMPIRKKQSLRQRCLGTAIDRQPKRVIHAALSNRTVFPALL